MKVVKLFSSVVLLLFATLTSAQPGCVAPPSGLTYWWTGNYSGEEIISGKTAAPRNGAHYAQGQVGGAFALDGSNDYFITPRVSTHQSFTIEAWVKLSPKNTTNWRYSQGIVSQYQGGNGRYFIWEANPKLTGLSLYDGRWGGTGAALANQWHHIAVVHNKATGRKYHYIDGVLKAVNSALFTSPIYYPFKIGYTGDYNRVAKGLIDEVSYYSRALSADEINSIFEAGSAGKCNGPQDTVAPEFVARRVNFDASTTTIDGRLAINEPGQITVTVTDEQTGSMLATTTETTYASTPYSADFSLPLDPSTMPQIVRVSYSAVDQAGNTSDTEALLLLTDFTSSNIIEPDSGVSITIQGAQAQMSPSVSDGRPVVDVTTDGQGQLMFDLTADQALSLCGSGNDCEIWINGQPVTTQMVVHDDGSVQFTADYSGNGQTDQVTLGFDSTAGGAGVLDATDPNTGNQVSAQGDVVQTTIVDDEATVTAGDVGGQVVISFTLSQQQDELKCLGAEGLCVIQQNLSVDLPTERLELSDGQVRYQTTVILSPGEVNLYSLKVLDNQPPEVGDITIAAPLLKGGVTTTMQLAVTDNTSVVSVMCHHTLPDGTVIDIPATQNQDGSWSWEFTPPQNVPSGEILISVDVTDLGGNVVTVQPTDVSGQPASILLDNDVPVIQLPANPITAPRYYLGKPVADRGQCVRFTVSASDETSGIADFTFIVNTPQGGQIEVTGIPGDTDGTFIGDYCVPENAASGNYDITMIATDGAGNVKVLQCESFEVNTPPVVDAGPDIWVSPGMDGQFVGSFTDPDANDSHTIVWDMGDGNQVSGSLTPAYSYLAPGIYTARLTVTDSFGGIDWDERVIYVVGNGQYGDIRGSGFWKQQFRGGKGHSQKISDEDLGFYLTLIRTISSVFDELAPLTTLNDANGLLNLKKATTYQRALQHTLAAWLNFAHGGVRYDDAVDVDGDGIDDMTFIDAMTTIESILTNPASTNAQLDLAKSMAESIGG